MALSAKAIDWAKARGISESTLAALGVDSGTTWMGDDRQECEVIAFPYRRGAKVINVKYRTIEGKDFKQVTGGELRFWNADPVFAGDKREVFIVEGEPDLMALIEAGVALESVLSVPNGAPSQASDAPEQQDRYRYIETALGEGLGKIRKFVIAVDQDAPGLALRQDLVRLLGAARCSFIDWPYGCKDANEFLIRFGAEDLRSYLTEAAQEWPVEGLYRLSELPEQPPFETWLPGFREWEGKLRFAARTLSVVTGYPGDGKTTLMMQIWYQICRDYSLAVAVASFETRPKPHQRKNIRQFMFGKPEAQLSDNQITEADRWADDHIFWMAHPNRKASLKWLLDTAEVAIVRHRARAVIIDPWNKLEGDRPPGMSETDYIGQCLDACMDFASDMNVHMQILAHPAKTDRKDRKYPPELYDISGSQHWNNKVDLGLCVHRPEKIDGANRKTEANLYVLKTRFEELGYPCKLAMNYEISQRRYVSTDYQVGPLA